LEKSKAAQQKGFEGNPYKAPLKKKRGGWKGGTRKEKALKLPNQRQPPRGIQGSASSTKFIEMHGTVSKGKIRGRMCGPRLNEA